MKMDPNTALEQLLLALHRTEPNSSLCLNTVDDLWSGLFEWLKNGGFPPDVAATIEAVKQTIEENEK